MRRPRALPGRLLDGEATDFERRMLDAVMEQRPSAASSARMARALGVTVTSIGTAAASKALAANAAAKAGAATGASAVWHWISAGVLGLAVAGAVVGARTFGRHRARPESAVTAASPTAPPAAASPEMPAPPPAVEATHATPPSATPARRHRDAVTGDLRDEIAFVDAARDALSSGAAQRALELLRRYQERYPSGSFRPEATATRIEALVKLGRETEARALARRFVAEYRGSLLGARVAEMVGIAEPAAGP
ncbi:MAG TPA: hypothetical protein VKZ18_26810 [Polyangia bacterium]|nr:hypothetical protein [Polyangia bacterium]